MYAIIIEQWNEDPRNYSCLFYRTDNYIDVLNVFNGIANLNAYMDSMITVYDKQDKIILQETKKANLTAE